MVVAIIIAMVIAMMVVTIIVVTVIVISMVVIPMAVIPMIITAIIIVTIVLRGCWVVVALDIVVIIMIFTIIPIFTVVAVGAVIVIITTIVFVATTVFIAIVGSGGWPVFVRRCCIGIKICARRYRFYDGQNSYDFQSLTNTHNTVLTDFLVYFTSSYPQPKLNNRVWPLILRRRATVAAIRGSTRRQIQLDPTSPEALTGLNTKRSFCVHRVPLLKILLINWNAITIRGIVLTVPLSSKDAPFRSSALTCS